MPDPMQDQLFLCLTGEAGKPWDPYIMDFPHVMEHKTVTCNPGMAGKITRQGEGSPCSSRGAFCAAEARFVFGFWFGYTAACQNICMVWGCGSSSYSGSFPQFFQHHKVSYYPVSHSRLARVSQTARGRKLILPPDLRVNCSFGAPILLVRR